MTEPLVSDVADRLTQSSSSFEFPSQRPVKSKATNAKESRRGMGDPSELFVNIHPHRAQEGALLDRPHAIIVQLQAAQKLNISLR